MTHLHVFKLYFAITMAVADIYSNYAHMYLNDLIFYGIPHSAHKHTRMQSTIFREAENE